MRPILIASGLCVLSACSGSHPAAAPTAATQSMTNAQSGAIARIGDVSIRASAVQTSMLDAGIARRYDLARDAGTVLLLVAVRKGSDADAIALPARVSATATDLRGSRQAIVMRELRSGDPMAAADLIDYIGTVGTGLPDTLRFEIQVQPEGVAATTLQLSRDFYPQ